MLTHRPEMSVGLLMEHLLFRKIRLYLNTQFISNYNNPSLIFRYISSSIYLCLQNMPLLQRLSLQIECRFGRIFWYVRVSYLLPIRARVVAGCWQFFGFSTWCFFHNFSCSHQRTRIKTAQETVCVKRSVQTVTLIPVLPFQKISRYPYN